MTDQQKRETLDHMVAWIYDDIFQGVVEINPVEELSDYENILFLCTAREDRILQAVDKIEQIKPNCQIHLIGENCNQILSKSKYVEIDGIQIQGMFDATKMNVYREILADKEMDAVIFAGCGLYTRNYQNVFEVITQLYGKKKPVYEYLYDKEIFVKYNDPAKFGMSYMLYFQLVKWYNESQNV